MLTGRAPPDGASPGSAVRAGAEPATTAVPQELDAIVRRAMAERMEDRYQSAVSFAAELRSVAAILDIRSGYSEPPSQLTASEEASDRSWRWVISLLVVLVLAFAAWLWLG